MKSALEWIVSAIAPSSASRDRLSALNDPFYTGTGISNETPSQCRMTESETIVTFQNGQLQRQQQQEEHDPDPFYEEPWEDREGRLCALVYNGLSHMSSHVRKSMLYSNDVIISSEKDGDTVRSVYWMGANHLYATVFKSCQNAQESVLYRRPFYTASMSGMRMIGIPAESVNLIIDALWAQLLARGYKVYSEDGQVELKPVASSSLSSSEEDDAATSLKKETARVEFDTREPDTEAEKTTSRRRVVAAVQETSKNK